MNCECLLCFPELTLATASKHMSSPECYFPCLCSIYCRVNAAGKAMEMSLGLWPHHKDLFAKPQDPSQHSVNELPLSSSATAGPAFVQASREDPQIFF